MLEQNSSFYLNVYTLNQCHSVGFILIWKQTAYFLQCLQKAIPDRRKDLPVKMLCKPLICFFNTQKALLIYVTVVTQVVLFDFHIMHNNLVLEEIFFNDLNT